MKNVRLKKLRDQVMVITGTSSGIGLVTARMAARYGTKLVLAARNGEALKELCSEVQSQGGEAIYVQGDVGVESDVREIATQAITAFGRTDTWVNNAAVSIYGRIMEVPNADMRKLFETNFWGIVYGSKIAVEHLRKQGGALINLGSTVSDAAVPLQGAYVASKHAIKGFTDSLRLELEADGAPISVTLIKPAAIDTPYPKHARNYLDVEPKLPPPVYAPELVAEAILHAAEHPVRDLFVGEAAKMMSAMHRYSPRLSDRYMEATHLESQRTQTPADPNRADGLDQASFGLEERGGHPGMVFERSPYTEAQMHPVIASAIAIGAGFAVAALWRARLAERS